MKRLLLLTYLFFFCIGAYAQYTTHDCQYYYYKNTANDTAHYKFKKCVVKAYYSYDSLFAHKRYNYTYTSYFNSDGNRIYSFSIDSNKVITDSTRYRYNANGNMIFDAEYRRDDSGIMKRTFYEVINRDAHGTPLKDSIVNQRYGTVAHVSRRR